MQHLKKILTISVIKIWSEIGRLIYENFEKNPFPWFSPPKIGKFLENLISSESRSGAQYVAGLLPGLTLTYKYLSTISERKSVNLLGWKFESRNVHGRSVDISIICHPTKQTNKQTNKQTKRIGILDLLMSVHWRSSYARVSKCFLANSAWFLDSHSRLTQNDCTTFDST